MVILGATLTLSNSHSAVGGPGNAAEKAQNLEVPGEEPSKVSMADQPLGTLAVNRIDRSRESRL